MPMRYRKKFSMHFRNNNNNNNNNNKGTPEDNYIGHNTHTSESTNVEHKRV
jgi:hypothetical protein